MSGRSALSRRTLRHLVLPLLVALVVTGCGTGTRQDAGDSRPRGGRQTQPAPAGFDLLLEIDSPDWLAEGFGSLWVKQDDGAVVRVSPAGQVEATIDADLYEPPVCQGIGVSSHAVWACATTGTVIRIDPRTNKIVATLEVGKINDQGRLTFSAGRVWVLTGDGQRLDGLSEQDNKVHDSIRLGTFCTDTSDTAPRGVLWVVCAYQGLLLRVDLRSGQVTGRVRGLSHASAVSADRDVWVAYDGGMARVDPHALRVVQRVRVQPTSVRAMRDGVWVREEGRHFLSRVDPDTGRIGSRTVTARLPSGGDLIRFGQRWWATASDDGAAVRVAQ